MSYWTPLQTSDVLALFEEGERASVCGDAELIASMMGDMAARVREVCAANAANVLPMAGEGDTCIPRSLRQHALAILRRDLLLRYALPLSDARATAALDAEKHLELVRVGKYKILDAQGNMPCAPGATPSVISKGSIYSTGGGFFS